MFTCDPNHAGALLEEAVAIVMAPTDSRKKCGIFRLTTPEGLAVVREHRPDLVLLDYNMPVLDGLGMLRELRADPEIARTNVIMLTANTAPQALAAVARLGVRDYVVKPHDGPVLLAKVARLITLIPRACAQDSPVPHV